MKSLGTLCTGIVLLGVVAAAAPASIPASAYTSNGLRGLLAPVSKQSAYCMWKSLALPNIAIPSYYDVKLRVPLAEPFAVTGSVSITFKITKSTDCIVINAGNMKITSIAAVQGRSKISGEVHGRDENSQMTAIMFNKWLAPGTYTLNMAFNFKLGEGVDGLYKSVYTENGKEEVLASTQFQSIAARKALPCFDEPRFKARFRLTLETPPPPVVALSNMPVVKTTPLSGGWVRRTYQTSPKMSSYLLAFVVGKLVKSSITCPTRTGSIPVSTWGTFARKSQLGTSPKMACASVQRMEKITDVNFMLPKLDLVAIPEFAAGAMENWGLIMYRETALLVDATVDDIQQIQSVGITVAHEVVHMWLGDLVTMRNWGELWLNEGFATYFMFSGSDAYAPRFRAFDFFYAEDTAGAFAEDSDSSAHPLSVPGTLPTLAAIDIFFDAIEYQKGAAVIRMLRAYLNRNRANPDAEVNPAKDPFLKGLSAYIRKYRLATVTYKDLYKSLSQSTAQPVDKWMETWTLRANYPVLTLKRLKDNSVVVFQQPITSGSAPEDPLDKCTAKKRPGAWWIPLAWRTQSRAVTWHAFPGCQTKLRRPVKPTEYVLLNAGRYGYYRVNYSKKDWALLAAAARLKPSQKGYIDDADLSGLIDDAAQLSSLGQLDIAPFLDLTATLGARLQTKAYQSWSLALDGLGNIILLLNTAQGMDPAASCSKQLVTWLQKDVTGAYINNIRLPASGKPLTLTVNPKDDVYIRFLRPVLFGSAGQLGNKALLESGKKLLLGAANSAKGGKSLHPDIRGTVYALAVMSGDDKAYDAVQKLYLKETDAHEKLRLLAALAAANTPKLIKRSLDFAVSPSVRLSDMSRFLANIGLKGGLAFNMTWDFILTKTPTILKRYPRGGTGTEAAYTFGLAVSRLSNLFVDEKYWLPRLEPWAKKYSNILDPEFIKGLKSTMAQNSLWLKTQGKDVCTWLASKGYKG